MKIQRELSPFERWMVKSNLETIRSTGVSISEHTAILRANGYPSIAAAVEQAWEGA